MKREILTKKQIEHNIKLNSSNKLSEWDMYCDTMILYLINWINFKLEESVKLNASNPRFFQEISYSFLQDLTHRLPPFYKDNGMLLIISELKNKVNKSGEWVLIPSNVKLDVVKIVVKERKHKVSFKKLFKYKA